MLSLKPLKCEMAGIISKIMHSLFQKAISHWGFFRAGDSLLRDIYAI